MAFSNGNTSSMIGLSLPGYVQQSQKGRQSKVHQSGGETDRRTLAEELGHLLELALLGLHHRKDVLARSAAEDARAGKAAGKDDSRGEQ